MYTVISRFFRASLSCGFPKAFMVFGIPLYLVGFVDFKWSQLPDALPDGQIVIMGGQTNALARITNEVFFFPKTVTCLSECAPVEWFYSFLLVAKLYGHYHISKEVAKHIN